MSRAYHYGWDNPLPSKSSLTKVAVLDFNAIVDEHADYVYRVAFRIMGNSEDAEDVSQDTFLSAYRASNRFRGESEITTWLYRIAVNAALMRLRKTKLARALTESGFDDIDVVDWNALPLEEAVNTELGEKIHEGINRLELHLRDAIVVGVVGQRSNAESADVLNLTVPALKSRLHRARVRLRAFLSDYVAVPK